MSLLLIKNVRLIDPLSERDEICDILIKNKKILQFGNEINSDEAQIIDASGLIAAPGLVDMHVHLRDPGQTDKEDIITGCRAAAAGGVTSLLCMPNTSPAADNPKTVRYILDKSKDTGIHVYVAASITKGLSGEEPSDIHALKESGAIALTDDGRPVENSRFLSDALITAQGLNMCVVSHCEDISLANGGIINEGSVSKKLGVKGIPSAAEDADTARVLAIASAFDVPVHICHVSTSGSVDMIRDFKRRGARVTCETAPHYFAFNEDSADSKDADYRMNPPLRSEADRLAVIEGLKDGTIDAIATDHAPHTIEEKKDFLKAPNGVIGMETSLSASLSYLKGSLSISEIIEKMSVNPAKILNIDAGSLSVGSRADIVIFDPDEKWTVDINKLHGKSKNAVFKEKTLCGKVKITISDGEIIFDE